jgi:hypothetical protein
MPTIWCNSPYYFMAFAAGNLLGPLTIGRLFGTIGRRKTARPDCVTRQAVSTSPVPYQG